LIFSLLDRRTAAVVGAVLCYLSRTYLFPSNPINLLEAVDFNVLILLASIMIINHIVIHLKETKKVISYFQSLIKENPLRGFWMLSFMAFLVSPFLTNDGVCLLLVEPILFAFQDASTSSSFSSSSLDPFTVLPLEDVEENRGSSSSAGPSDGKQKLDRVDILYFLLALACSTNIGSTLTYTGNPQNMIVASDSIEVLPSYKFLLYMILPGTLAWFISKFALFFVSPVA
jgi:Na+/H+ antiporter NhaD/arsenite permease-like protein